MTPGYDKPLYLLPFDHRKSYLRDILHLSAALSVRQREAVMETKQVIYAGFCTALTRGVPDEFAGILVDEEFGAVILRHASAKGYTTALPLEKSGSREVEFECGPDFASQIEAFRPTFAKALVRFNPEGDSARNRRQVARLKQLSDYCRSVGQRFMFELLVPATPEQLARATHADTYDEAMRPSLVLAAIRELQDAGVE